MKVKGKKTIDFPTLGWGVRKGEEKELPSDKKSQDEILKSPYVEKIAPAPKTKKVENKKEDNEIKENE